MTDISERGSAMMGVSGQEAGISPGRHIVIGRKNGTILSFPAYETVLVHLVKGDFVTQVFLYSWLPILGVC